MTLRFALLGRPEILAAGKPLQFRTRKVFALLVYLALEPGWHNRAHLTGLLWGNSGEAQSRSSLRKALSFLNVAFEVSGLVPPVHIRRDALSFDHGAELEIDCVLLARAFTDHENVALSEQVLTLHRGEFLSGFSLSDAPEFEDWAQYKRTLCAAQLDAVLEGLGQHYALNDAPARAEAVLRERVAHDPFNERAHRALIAFLLQTAQRSSALEAYRACRATLMAEFSLEPTLETTQLVRQLLGHASHAAELRAGNDVFENRSVMPNEPRLVGREGEWARLEAAWQRGQTMLISGSAGVGKTRLAMQFAHSKGKVFTIWGRPGDEAVPYSTHARVFGAVLEQNPALPLPNWVRLEMSRILPQLGAHPAPITNDEDKLRFFEAKVAFYQAHAPLGWDVQVFDDLQFVDAATIEAGVYMHSKLLPYQPGFPRCIFVFRAGQLKTFEERRLREWVSAGLAIWIDLEPLSETQVAALLEDLGSTRQLERHARELTRYTGGNPLLVLETARLMLERDPATSVHLPLSERAQAVTLERIAQLSADAQQLVRVAAVAGERFDVNLAQAVTGASVAALLRTLEELERAQVMHGLRFSHDLIFEAVLNSLPLGVRTVLHTRVLDYLSVVGASAPVLLVHAEGAGRWSAILEYALVSARAAQQLYLPDDTASFAQRALRAVNDQLTTASDKQRGELEELVRLSGVVG